jgi:hypothetical protein
MYKVQPVATSYQLERLLNEIENDETKELMYVLSGNTYTQFTVVYKYTQAEA